MRIRSYHYVRNFLIIFICVTLLFPLITLLILPSSTIGELGNEDFANLKYTDPKGDQFTHYQKFEEDSNTQIESYGVIGKDSKSFDLKTCCIDIVDLKASLNSGTVTITVEFASDIMYGMSLAYHVFIVESSHQQPDDLLNPETQTGWLAFWDYADDDNSIVEMVLDHDSFDGVYAWSSPDMPSLTGNANGNIITLTVSVTDLEDAGLTTGSDFGLFAYSHLRGSSFEGDEVIGEVTWDTAGVGAAEPPKEFNTDLYGESDDKSDDAGKLLLGAAVCIGGVIAVVVVIVVVILYLKKKKEAPPQMQYYPPQSQQYPPQPPQKPV